MTNLLLLLLHALFLAQYMPYPGAVALRGVPSTPVITGQTLGTLRSNFTGCVGFVFQTGASPITVTDLGRWVVAGNSATHSILLNGTGGVSVSATVNTSGATPGAYAYTSITPTVLAASGAWAIFSAEVNGGDQWYDNDTVLTSTAVITVTNAAVQSSPPACNGGGGINAGANNSYVPPNFKYHL